MTEGLVRLATGATGQTATAAEILAAAFAQDPVMAYFTEPAPSSARPALRRRVIASLIRLHQRSGHSLWGWRVDGALLGCAMVEDAASRWRRAGALLRELPALLRLPLPVLRRLNAYGARSQHGRPQGATLFLTMIGLGDGGRGQGHGRRFMAALHRHYGSSAHWALDTENPDNLAFYESLGYQLYATQPLGPVTLYKLHHLPEAGNRHKKP